jgi:DNA polymerase
MSTLYSIILDAPDDFEGFREAARGLIAAKVPPAQVSWNPVGEVDLFGVPPPVSEIPLMLPAAFKLLAEKVVCHRDPERFALLYTCAWRISHGERALLGDAADPIVHRLARMEKEVRRDLHKMTAFVRFRKVETEIGEHYVAWFEPEHHILRKAAGFFRDRFATMHWTILTPEASIRWDRAELHFGPGVSRSEAPPADDLENWWRTYYRATFNPARANPEAMRAEMPKKYWHNLPEAPLIPELIADAAKRTKKMMAAPGTRPRKARDVFGERTARLSTSGGSLAAVAAKAKRCERCPLYAPATQTVFGEGPQDAPVVFVGEQPGDQEDLAGQPFVGPAGQMFDRALGEAGIERKHVYVTNAVKHFKFEPRGKRRIHSKPNNYEIEQCRWWLDKELGLIQPRLTVALGATAARALTGRTVTISRERAKLMDLRPDLRGFITVHPSFLLRLPDRAAQAREYRRFVQDLELVAAHIPEIRKAA